MREMLLSMLPFSKYSLCGLMSHVSLCVAQLCYISMKWCLIMMQFDFDTERHIHIRLTQYGLVTDLPQFEWLLGALWHRATLMAPGPCLNQCWLVIAKAPAGQWVKGWLEFNCGKILLNTLLLVYSTLDMNIQISVWQLEKLNKLKQFVTFVCNQDVYF